MLRHGIKLAGLLAWCLLSQPTTGPVLSGPLVRGEEVADTLAEALRDLHVAVRFMFHGICEAGAPVVPLRLSHRIDGEDAKHLIYRLFPADSGFTVSERSGSIYEVRQNHMAAPLLLEESVHSIAFDNDERWNPLIALDKFKGDDDFRKMQSCCMQYRLFTF